MVDVQINEVFLTDFDKILNQSLVPHISNKIVRPCVEKDFQHYKETLISNFHAIIKVLDIIKNEKCRIKRIKNNLLKLIIIIGEQHIKSTWNTNEIVEFSKILKCKICIIFESKSITEVLKDDMFLMILLFLRPKLLKNTWKSNPASVICYKWLLESVNKFVLRKHISEILPTALIIFDDYIVENQILGLKCINLIIEHCQKSASLKNFNYDEVIFQALVKMALKVEYNINSTFKVSNMITSLYSCVASLLQYIECYENNNTAFGWTKRDDILAILLDNMELQTNTQFQYAYILSASRLFIHNSSGKWSERLTRILSDYSNNHIDLNTTKAILDLITTFVSIYQPRGLNFYNIIYSLLIKLRYKLILLKIDIKEFNTIDQCLLSLNKLCPNLSKEVLENDKIQSIINVI